MLARVLATSPRALVLDEPTTGLISGPATPSWSRCGIVRDGMTRAHPHHSEEIVPEIDRVLLLQDGRIVADGAKPEVLTGERLSTLFGLPLTVELAGGYYYARPSSA
jgi:iron complex transport system ATP-binding protein